MTYVHRKDQTLALENLSFSVTEKEFLCILGPSGCGKSTALRLIAGFVRPDSGEVRVDGQLVSRPGADRGVVFQRYNLFPWKRVRQNIEFGLRMRAVSKTQRNEVVSQYLEEMKLTEFADSYPFMLSAGMQQRVGLARAYANNPDILLMDEPFASLDAQSATRMRELLLRVWSGNPRTIVFVTHDVDEAMGLGDRVLVFSHRPGRVRQIFEIDLPRPRPHDVFENHRYMELRKGIMESVLDAEKDANSRISVFD
jgi:NitT/TauT family transport system ATP-binding protein